MEQLNTFKSVNNFNENSGFSNGNGGVGNSVTSNGIGTGSCTILKPSEEKKVTIAPISKSPLAQN
ncbi:MAG: hypothetical protein HC903_10640 [Methylacidiphilales bacterium]|nr:hypothetical protein [Candidatus Methylacidiphilales bacterium]